MLEHKLLKQHGRDTCSSTLFFLKCKKFNDCFLQKLQNVTMVVSFWGKYKKKSKHKIFKKRVLGQSKQRDTAIFVPTARVLGQK